MSEAPVEVDRRHHLPGRRSNAWFWRRVLIYAVITFCMTMLTWLAWYGTADSQLHLLIASGCFWLITGVLAFYVFGASFDDLQYLKFLPGGIGAGMSAMSQRVDTYRSTQTTTAQPGHPNTMGPP